eukprot:6600786-Prymnesium_polylepis.1
MPCFCAPYVQPQFAAAAAVVTALLVARASSRAHAQCHAFSCMLLSDEQAGAIVIAHANEQEPAPVRCDTCVRLRAACCQASPHVHQPSAASRPSSAISYGASSVPERSAAAAQPVSSKHCLPAS